MRLFKLRLLDKAMLLLLLIVVEMTFTVTRAEAIASSTVSALPLLLDNLLRLVERLLLRLTLGSFMTVADVGALMSFMVVDFVLYLIM